MKLLKTIETLKSLTAGTSGGRYKVKVHNLPDKPSDITDDGEFHYAVLGPKAASTSGNPSAEARRFLDETTRRTAPASTATPSCPGGAVAEGLEVARTRIRDYLGWEEVQSQLKDQDVDPDPAARRSPPNLEAAKKRVPEAVQQAYNIVVTVSEANEVQAFKLTLDTTSRCSTRSRPTLALASRRRRSATKLLPEGPYDLWRSGETARRVKDLVGAFAQFPHLPKMLRRKEILDTLVQGVLEGIGWRSYAPDRSVKTFWRTPIDEWRLRIRSRSFPARIRDPDRASRLTLLGYETLRDFGPDDRSGFRRCSITSPAGTRSPFPREGWKET